MTMWQNVNVKVTCLRDKTYNFILHSFGAQINIYSSVHMGHLFLCSVDLWFDELSDSVS